MLNLTKIDAQLKAKVIILAENFVIRRNIISYSNIVVRTITEHFNVKNTTKPLKAEVRAP